MRELLETLDTWRADPGSSPAVGRAIVVRTFGSAPRPEGAVLLYADDGRIAGSVSGGCVEGAAAEEIDPADEDNRLRAMVTIAIRDSARIAADRGPEEALEPLLRARDLLGARADNELVRAMWRRYLPASVVVAAAVTLFTFTPS